MKSRQFWVSNSETKNIEGDVRLLIPIGDQYVRTVLEMVKNLAGDVLLTKSYIHKCICRFSLRSENYTLPLEASGDLHDQDMESYDRGVSYRTQAN